MDGDRKPKTSPVIPDLELPALKPSGAPGLRTSGVPPVRTSGAPSVRTSGAPPGPSSARGQGAVTAPPAAAPRGPQDYFGSGTFDEDHFGDSGASLALDTDDRTAPPRTSHPHLGAAVRISSDTGADDLDLYESSATNAETLHEAPPASFDRRKWPTGAAPDSASLRIDPVEIKLTADYPEAPELLVQAPLYSARVLQRKRELARKTVSVSAAFEEAGRHRDELLVLLVQDLRGTILLTDDGEALFEPIVAIERVALERRAALSGVNAEYDGLATELEGQLKKVERELEEHEIILDQRRGALTELTRSLERLEAKKKRLFIELSGLVDLSEKSGGKLSPAQGASVTRLEAEIAAQKPGLDGATRAVEASGSVLAAAEADLRKIQHRGRDVERQRRTLDERFQKQIGARSAGVSETDAERFAAFADLGRRVLAGKGRLVDVDSKTLEAIGRADETVLGRLTELERHLRALDAYDADLFKKGLVVAVVAAAALLVAIVALALH